MITAKDARELTKGSMKYKGLWFKTRLNWICGCINKSIENTADKGETFVDLTFSDNVMKKYCSIITQLYEKQGYIIGYNISNGIIEIRWDNDFYKLNNRNGYTCFWDYSTKEEMNNESTSKTSGNRKNKGAIVYRGKK